ncbi:dTMP kinase [Denitrobaculum tricleocarpae]|uniref:Thymidylate kinase n=1 Tax=Denitrobaculum tricleocarpae TaxID=2591009 RepID=A0A545TPS0_9PROT|nr:dTMP kinase [Denitrobaculum tricleocarpae]TQV79222.1 dTMP kinase [Denitrobaculum tricleocarpae]
MVRGKFITFEGGEGAGKTTQIKRLAEKLSAAGLQVTTTREPGGSPGAEQIRALLVNGEAERWSATTEALLHFAARRDHLEKTVIPALDAGHWVLCDRFIDSTMAYQGYGHELGRDIIESLQAIVVDDIFPDLTVIMDIDPEEGLGRAGSRAGGEDRYESMDLAFHQRLREGFLDIAKRAPERCALVPARDSIEALESRILDLLRNRLELDLT